MSKQGLFGSGQLDAKGNNCTWIGEFLGLFLNIKELSHSLNCLLCVSEPPVTISDQYRQLGKITFICHLLRNSSASRVHEMHKGVVMRKHKLCLGDGGSILWSGLGLYETGGTGEE